MKSSWLPAFSTSELVLLGFSCNLFLQPGKRPAGIYKVQIYIQRIHYSTPYFTVFLYKFGMTSPHRKIDKLRIELAIWTVSRLVIHKKPWFWGQEIPSSRCRKSLTPGLPGPLIGPSCCLQKIRAVWLYLSFLSCQNHPNWVEFNFGDSMTVTKLDPQSWRSLNHLKGSKVNSSHPQKRAQPQMHPAESPGFCSLRFIG